MRWQNDTLLLEGLENINDYFDREIITKINSIKQKEIIKDDRLLLNKIPVLIKDYEKPILKIQPALQYYKNKVEFEKYYFFKEIQNSPFQMIEKTANYKITDFFRNNLERLNCEGINKSCLEINPDFFDDIIEVNIKKSDELIYLRNIVSSAMICDKISINEREILISFIDRELQFITLNFNDKDLERSNIFNWAYKWISSQESSQEILKLKLQVVKIFFSELNYQKLYDKTMFYQELDNIYKIVLNKESERYYNVKKEINDLYTKLNNEKAKINLEFNQKVLSLIISIPIAFYGFYFAIKKDNQEFSIFNDELVFLYLIYFIASVYIGLLFKNYLTILTKNNEDYIEFLCETHKINLIDKERYKLNLFSDFKLFFFTLSTLVSLLAIFLLYFLFKNW